MKQKVGALLLILALNCISQSYAQTSTASLANTGEYITNPHFWGGIFLGLQQNTASTSNSCYKSYIVVVRSIDQFTKYYAGDYLVDENAMGISGSEAGYYGALAIKGIDIAKGCVNIYGMCDFKNLINNMGTKLNSLHGVMDLGVNITFRVLTDSTTLLASCLSNNNWGCLGTQFGNYAKLILEQEVAEFDYVDYTALIPS